MCVRKRLDNPSIRLCLSASPKVLHNEIVYKHKHVQFELGLKSESVAFHFHWYAVERYFVIPSFQHIEIPMQKYTRQQRNNATTAKTTTQRNRTQSVNGSDINSLTHLHIVDASATFGHIHLCFICISCDDETRFILAIYVQCAFVCTHVIHANIATH